MPLSISDIYAFRTIVNSIASVSDTSLSVNITTPNDANYVGSFFYYRKLGAAEWVYFTAASFILNTTENITITGLEKGFIYEVQVVAADTTFRQSVPSQIFAVLVGTENTGAEKKFMDNMEYILSISQHFQSWTGAANQAIALTFIKKRVNDTPSGKHAIISLAISSNEMVDTSNRLTLASIALKFIDPAASAYAANAEEAELETFADKTGAIITELMQIQGQNSNLIIQDIDITDPHEADDRDYADTDLALRVEYSVQTGI